MDILPITPTIGAEINEVDLAALDSSSFAAIEHAFLKYLILVFRDQILTRDQHKVFLVACLANCIFTPPNAMV